MNAVWQGRHILAEDKVWPTTSHIYENPPFQKLTSIFFRSGLQHSLKLLLSEKPQGIISEFTLGRHKPVECLSCDAEFFAEVAHLGIAIDQPRLGKADLRCRHRELATTFPATGTGGGKPGPGALGNELPLKFGQCAQKSRR